MATFTPRTCASHIKLKTTEALDSKKSSLLLALHSSTESLGVGVWDSSRPPNSTHRIEIFPIGRSLSNKLIECVEEILPKHLWSKLSRIAVAIGPGGFTSTRLTVVMARTLSEQLNCPLDGISSFELMAPRLIKSIPFKKRKDPFWIIQPLKRRGIIAGKYLVKEQVSDLSKQTEVLEIEAPHLLPIGSKVEPALEATEDLHSDVIRLLNISATSHHLKKKANWNNVLPIYPTSPVDG